QVRRRRAHRAYDRYVPAPQRRAGGGTPTPDERAAVHLSRRDGRRHRDRDRRAADRGTDPYRRRRPELAGPAGLGFDHRLDLHEELTVLPNLTSIMPGRESMDMDVDAVASPPAIVPQARAGFVMPAAIGALVIIGLLVTAGFY